MPSHARTVTRTTHRVRNALLVVLLLLVVCAAAAGFSGFKLYKSAMSAKAHLNNVVNAAKVIKDGSTDDMVKALSDVSYIQKEAAAAKQDASLSSGDGQLNMEQIIAAAQQLATVDQSVQSQARTIQDLPDAKLGVVNNALQNGKTQMAALAQVTENLSGMLNMLPNFLGANGARNYVLLAQTNSEIRGTRSRWGSSTRMPSSPPTPRWMTSTRTVTARCTADCTSVKSFIIFRPRRTSRASRPWPRSSGRRLRSADRPTAMIGATGDVTLSDGRVLNGSNTAEFLLNGAYKELTPSAQDQYFSETAAQAVAHLFSDMNTQKLMTVAKTMLRMAEQRHLYFWSFHEEDQAVLRSAGVTGEITNDAKNPVTGVYSNEMQASKMDWYIQRKSTVKRTGDNTYHVTYSFTNTLQPGEAGSLPEYITANAKGGVAVNRVVIYTPAGGEVSNVSASNGSSFAQVQAKDHMTYMDDISLAPQDTVTIEYDVTTAAGSANLKLDQTPTIGDPAITYEY